MIETVGGLPAIEGEGFAIGPGRRCFIVAEIGINHNGDMALAREMIDVAAEAGADSVKVQNYATEDFIGDRSITYDYVSQGRTVVESQFEMFKRYELSRDDLAGLSDHCRGRGIVFHSTPTSVAGVAALLDVGVGLLKNGSDYLTHLPLIQAMGETGLPTVLSTGMATEEEIEDAVTTFRGTGNDRLVLLHCTSAYPTAPAETNLRRISELSRRFACLSGFSDHTDGTRAAIGAVALGACLVEKHFTIDKSLPGPDHRFSMDPAELRDLVSGIREMEKMLGSPALGPTESEVGNRLDFRLSCVAARDLPAGHVLGEADIAFRRPGTGVPPRRAGELIGRPLKAAVEANRQITPDCVVAGA